MSKLLAALFGSPRRVLALISITCFGLIAFGIYLQEAFELVPCPMCIVQRYAFIVVGVFTGIACLFRARWWQGLWGSLAFGISGFGALVAARQTLLQWNPPEFYSCGRDFYGVIESSVPWRDRIPMLFKGTGDCSEVEWTFLNLSIANWSFICFAGIMLLLLILAVRVLRRSSR